MFTGIVKSMGMVRDIQSVGGDVRLEIETGGLSLAGCSDGDSIAVSGACLTMIEHSTNHFVADVSTETLSLTTLGELEKGDPVNLELSLTLQDLLGGHLVTGHVDGLAILVSRKPDGRSERFEFEVPDKLAGYIASKGSVCLSGTSLTVNSVQGRYFSVCLIPHTLEVTTLGGLTTGDRVNLEIDLVARYVERLNSWNGQAEPINNDDPT
jgi:riboflavin synthase